MTFLFGSMLPLQAKKGGFKDTCPEELLAAVLREAYTRAKLDPSKIE
jgi:acetyl-CoA acyltransferase 1